MKRIFLFCVILLAIIQFMHRTISQPILQVIIRSNFILPGNLRIYRENKNLMLEIVGQGKTGLTPLTGNTFSVNGCA